MTFDFAVGERQAPGRQDAVDIVPYPGIGVIAMGIDGGAGRQQAADPILPIEDDGAGLVENRGLAYRSGW